MIKIQIAVNHISCNICITENDVFKISILIADSAHFESVPPSFCRFASFCKALCYFVRVNFMIHADCYWCRIHVMYFRFFFLVHFHQEVHKCKDEYSRFICCLHEILIIREIWNFVTHQFPYHFMIIFQISHFKMKSVDVQRDNLLKAQLSFRGPRFPLNFEIRNSYIKFPLRLLKNMLVKL